MFGLSLPKLLFTIVVVMAIWHGFKWLARLQEDQLANRERARKGRRATASAGTPNVSSRSDEIDSEDMIKCPICETYVSTTAAVSCGRDGCPYPD